MIDYASFGKPDAPSGTAREVAERLDSVHAPAVRIPVGETLGSPEARGATVGATQVHSLRLPSFTVSTEVLFAADGERLSIRHDAGESAAPYVAGTLHGDPRAAGPGRPDARARPAARLTSWTSGSQRSMRAPSRCARSRAVSPRTSRRSSSPTAGRSSCGGSRASRVSSGSCDRWRRAAFRVPRVHFVDEAAHALVMDHVDGVSGLEVPDVAERMADVLLRIHAAGVLHGDFWPGNTLWRGGELVAVLDWEDAGTGDPLADVGNARLELLWSHGADAMEAFTRRYGSPDPVALARWDLRADERSTSHIGEWGHDEATQARMRAARDEFVAAARRRLG